MKHSTLFSPIKLGNITLNNSIVMAPLTRSRSHQPGDIPTEMNAIYYAQRATAGLIITEATNISLQGKGYPDTPGIYSPEQIEGWKKVTADVHKKGGKIFLQIWHVGRMSSALVNGLQPVAPSALIAENSFVGLIKNGTFVPVPCEIPRELSRNEIKEIVKEYAEAAKNAIKAGFDGVEIHGANGYLIDQFLRENTNKRQDEYGGSPEKRVKFLIEVTQAVADAIGKENTGLRLSPLIMDRDMFDEGIFNTLSYSLDSLNEIGIAYIHFIESDPFAEASSPFVAHSKTFKQTLRQKFSGKILVAGGFTPESAQEMLDSGLADLIVFGRPFISNPDFVERIKNDYPLNAYTDRSKWYGGGAEGYIDYENYKVV